MHLSSGEAAFKLVGPLPGQRACYALRLCASLLPHALAARWPLKMHLQQLLARTHEE